MSNHPSILLPIYKRLREDKRLEIYFTNSRYSGKDGLGFELPEMVEPTAIVPNFHAKWKHWDFCIESDSTGRQELRWPALRVQSFHGGADKFFPGGRNFTLHKTLRKYDLLLCMSDRHVDMLCQAGLEKHPGAAECIGYPKLDVLVSGDIKRDEVLKSYGADPAQRTVLYAPSWNASLSLNQIGIELIEMLSGREWTFLVKPHPVSYRLRPLRPGHPAWGYGTDWRKILDDKMSQGKLIHVTDQDTCRCLTAADILITDYGSILFEYMVLDRPVLFYDSVKANATISAAETLPKIRRASHCFRRPEEAFSLLQTGLPDKPGMSEARKAIAQEWFYDIGGATVRAVKAIYKLMGLAPPSD